MKDPTTNFTVPAARRDCLALVPDARRCILWVAPFAGDQPLNAAGSIVDNTVQADLRAFVAAGGRLCVTGQEVASALTFNGQANNAAGSYLRRAECSAGFHGDSADNQTLAGSVGTGNFISYNSVFNFQAPFTFDDVLQRLF